ITVRHGSSAWVWKITARSRLGPSIAWLSTITVPADGSSSPARMLSTVVLPQPEWPMMQVKSPRCIGSQTSSNTVVMPPPAAGKRLAMPSMEMNLFAIALLREGHEPGQTRQDQVEQHADHADQQNGVDDVDDRQVVPLVPDEVTDASAADEHLGGDDHEPCNADGDSHARQDGGRCRRQDDGEGAAEGADLERLRHVEPFAPHRGDPERGVDHHWPQRADEDDEDRGQAGVLDSVERQRHPGER